MYQCVQNTKEGDLVRFENKMYRVQNYKGSLFIYPTINGKRVKKRIESLLFYAGTMADYVMNEVLWWQNYSFEEYQSYVNAEMLWV